MLVAMGLVSQPMLCTPLATIMWRLCRWEDAIAWRGLPVASKAFCFIKVVTCAEKGRGSATAYALVGMRNYPADHTGTQENFAFENNGGDHVGRARYPLNSVPRVFL